MALTDAKLRFPLAFLGAIFPVAASLDAKWNTCRGKCTSSFHATVTVFFCFFLLPFFFFFTVPPMCQVVAIVFRFSLSTYFLPPLRTLSVFLCFPLFNRRMHYRVPLSRCIRFQINFVWNSEFRLRIYLRIQKHHIQGYVNAIFVENFNFGTIVHM
jgi:hypothetical protein